jgi:hypothetical protein
MNTSRRTKSDLLTVLAEIDDDRQSIVDLSVAYVYLTANKKPRHFHSMGGFSRARKHLP